MRRISDWFWVPVTVDEGVRIPRALLLLLGAVLLVALCSCVPHKPPTPPPTPTPTPQPTATPSPTPAGPQIKPAWTAYCMAGGRWEGRCTSAVGNVASLHELTVGTTDTINLGGWDCNVAGSDTTAADNAACLDFYLRGIDARGRGYMIQSNYSPGATIPTARLGGATYTPAVWEQGDRGLRLMALPRAIGGALRGITLSDGTIVEDPSFITGLTPFLQVKDKVVAVTTLDETGLGRDDARKVIDWQRGQVLGAGLGPLAIWCVVGSGEGAYECDVPVFEAYGTDAEDGAAITAKLDAMYARLAPEQPFAVVHETYDHNGTALNSRRSAEHYVAGVDFCLAHRDRCAGGQAFSICRDGGAMDHQDWMFPLMRWGFESWKAGRRAGDPPMPPAPTPTPDHSHDPGVLWVWQSTKSFPAGTSQITFELYRKDGTTGRVTADWQAVCWTPSADCPTFSGQFVFENGQDAALTSFTAPAQSLPGHRYWHYYISNPTGGAQLESYPTTGGNLQLWANDPSVNWLLPTFPATHGNNVGMWVTRGGDLSQDRSVAFTVDDPQGCSYVNTYSVTIPADSPQVPLRDAVRVNADAPIGCSFVLHFAAGTPTGRTPSCTVTVQW